MNAQNARKLLRQLGNGVHHVPETDIKGIWNDQEMPCTEFERNLYNEVVPRRVSNLQELIEACTAHINLRLSKIATDWPIDYSEKQTDVLRALLLENFLLQHGFSTGRSVLLWLESIQEQTRTWGLTEPVLETLIGAIKSKNIREAVNCFVISAYNVTGNYMMGLLGFNFANSYAEVSPQWVAKYQKNNRPLQFWTDNDNDGPLLFIVYFSGKCTYLNCYGCALPSLSNSTAISPDFLFQQTGYVIDTMLSDLERGSLKSVFLSNNGSMFDEPTFSPVALHHAVARAMGTLPELKKIVFESRAEFLTDQKLESLNQLKREMGSTARFEVALGVEVFDEKIRNKVAKKGLSNRGIERLISLLGKHDFDLRCYFMLKPHPSMDDEQAYKDIADALDFLDKLSLKANLAVTMHLNPTYVAIGTDLETAFLQGQYIPPYLEDLEAFINKQAHRHTHIHIGLNDEGLAIAGGSFDRPQSAESMLKLKLHNMKVSGTDRTRLTSHE